MTVVGKKVHSSRKTSRGKTEHTNQSVTVGTGGVFQSGELKDLVLTCLGISVLVGGTLITPNFPIVLGSILKLLEKNNERRISPSKVRRTLASLQEQEIIQLVQRNGEVLVRITNKKLDVIKRYSIRELLRLKERKVNKPTEWTLVMFDVPELQRSKRDYLRKFLLWLGFYPYQKSVYAYPCDCRSEVEIIKNIVEGGRFVRYIIAKEIEDDTMLIQFFQARKKILHTN